MFLRINTIIFSMLAMLVFDGATAIAQGNDALFDAPWRAFDTGDFPTFIPDFFDVGDINGDTSLDAADIDTYIACLGGTCPQRSAGSIETQFEQRKGIS